MTWNNKKNGHRVKDTYISKLWLKNDFIQLTSIAKPSKYMNQCRASVHGIAFIKTR